MTKLGAAAVVLALAVAACGPQSGSKPEGRGLSALERSKIIPPSPAGPVVTSTGTVVEFAAGSVTLDHEGAADSGLAAGRTTFRTWAEVIADSPGGAGDRVRFKAQKLGDGWAVVEMTGR